MDLVNAFNTELCSLYSMKPPISKTKVVEITKLAMKAAKFYKHIVQSIERFVHKCQPEFKIPGLYVIDSIVRQSRHQFGVEKDLFTQRFGKNIAMTFHNLLSCASQEIPMIVRVLNLWQKNNVFSSSIIQPLLDMTSDPLNINVYLTAQKLIHRVIDESPSVTDVASKTPQSSSAASSLLPELDPIANDPQVDILKAMSQLLQQAQQPLLPVINPLPLQIVSQQQQQLLQQMQLLQQPEPQLQIDSNLMAQIQALTAALMSRVSSGAGGGGEFINTLDTSSPDVHKPIPDVRLSFTESDVEDERRETQSSSSFSNVVPALVSKRERIKTSSSKSFRLSSSSPPPEADVSFSYDADDLSDVADAATPRSQQRRFSLNRGRNVEDCFISSLALPLLLSTELLHSTPVDDEQNEEGERKKKEGSDVIGWQRERGVDWRWTNQSESLKDHRERGRDRERERDRERNRGRDRPDKAISRYGNRNEVSWTVVKDDTVAMETTMHRNKETDVQRQSKSSTTDRQKSSRSRSRSRVRSTERQNRSRSRGRQRSPTHQRSPGRLRAQGHQRSPVDAKRSVESADEVLINERNYKRQQTGLPPLKDKQLCICSTTLWIGNVSKQMKSNTLRSHLAKFGKVTLDLMSSRGCAFACFDTRQEASKALQFLNGNKLYEKTLKITWAPNIGIKDSEFKNRWDVDLGVTYIPWERLPSNIDALAVGAAVDEESLPDHMKYDQTTIDEVTSSTDCHLDAIATIALPSSVVIGTSDAGPAMLQGTSSTLHTGGGSTDKTSFIAPPPLIPGMGVASADVAVHESSSSSSVDQKEHRDDMDNVTAATVSTVATETAEIVAMETTTATGVSNSEELLIGIEKIMKTTAASNAANEDVAGIIKTNILEPHPHPSPAAATVVWPSIHSFNPMVPPPGFLPNFDPTQPPPCFAPLPSRVASEEKEKEGRMEESGERGGGGGEETMDTTIENMDIDDSDSSSADNDDFLESKIELLESGMNSNPGGNRRREEEAEGDGKTILQDDILLPGDRRCQLGKFSENVTTYNDNDVVLFRFGDDKNVTNPPPNNNNNINNIAGSRSSGEHFVGFSQTNVVGSSSKESMTLTFPQRPILFGHGSFPPLPPLNPFSARTFPRLPNSLSLPPPSSSSSSLSVERSNNNNNTSFVRPAFDVGTQQRIIDSNDRVGPDLQRQEYERNVGRFEDELKLDGMRSGFTIGQSGPENVACPIRMPGFKQDMQGGSGRMQDGSDGMRSEPTGMQGSPSGMQGGPTRMQGGPGGMLVGSTGFQSGPGGMQGRSTGMQGSPGGMLGGHTGMQSGPGGMQGGLGGMLGGSTGMQGGPIRMQDGTIGMQSGPGGMQGGHTGMEGGPGGMQGVPTGMQGGPGGMQGGPGVMQGGPGGMQGIPGGMLDILTGMQGGQRHMLDSPRGVLSVPRGMLGMQNEMQVRCGGLENRMKIGIDTGSIGMGGVAVALGSQPFDNHATNTGLHSLFQGEGGGGKQSGLFMFPSLEGAEKGGGSNGGGGNRTFFPSHFSFPNSDNIFRNLNPGDIVQRLLHQAGRQQPQQLQQELSFRCSNVGRQVFNTNQTSESFEMQRNNNNINNKTTIDDDDVRNRLQMNLSLFSNNLNTSSSSAFNDNRTNQQQKSLSQNMMNNVGGGGGGGFLGILGPPPPFPPLSTVSDVTKQRIGGGRGILGEGGKNFIPSLLSNLDNVLLPRALPLPTVSTPWQPPRNDRSFLSPQQRDTSGDCRRDDESSTEIRHVRRSDLFRSNRQQQRQRSPMMRGGHQRSPMMRGGHERDCNNRGWRGRGGGGEDRPFNYRRDDHRKYGTGNRGNGNYGNRGYDDRRREEYGRSYRGRDFRDREKTDHHRYHRHDNQYGRDFKDDEDYKEREDYKEHGHNECEDYNKEQQDFKEHEDYKEPENYMESEDYKKEREDYKERGHNEHEDYNKEQQDFREHEDYKEPEDFNKEHIDDKNDGDCLNMKEDDKITMNDEENKSGEIISTTDDSVVI